jgi:phosphocarrier protein HPr
MVSDRKVDTLRAPIQSDFRTAASHAGHFPNFPMNNLSDQKSSISARGPDSSHTLRQTFVLDLAYGLHARPCALLVKTLRPFRCLVEVQANGQQADGKSVMGLMALAAGRGSKITFTMTGEDAAPAMAAVSRVFETHFEDAYHAPSVAVS